MNGEHELRLERIEKGVEAINEKLDQALEDVATNRADVAWLKWAVRGILLGAVGGGAIVTGLAGF